MAKRRSSRKLTYREQLEKKIKAARKRREHAKSDGERMEAALEEIYYAENLSGVACASWKEFRTSWAGELWIRRQTQV